ncbi:terpenoid cyclases/protein prenyltransferase alpha-alpha toroid [Kockiozyma suomiensis]|uniref:terpenoid cyclases/protein prenyltransferase alpha-alpha toroid n=1 Tax=Kockiozyma suomiensis TaxID=1337062 RepID=UPI0033440AE2
MAAQYIPEINKVHNQESPLLDSLVTETSAAQNGTARSCEGLILEGQLPVLNRSAHSQFLQIPLKLALPSAFTGLDASKPWLIYWPLQALSLIDPASIPPDYSARVSASIFACISDTEGAIGGGNGQIAHLASTYAGVNALAISGDTKAWQALDRNRVYQFLMAMKCDDGGFRMHHGGEEDVRAVYCALATATLLDIMTEELVQGTIEWVSRCQTYEGGIGGAPDNEAHGGYAFCGLASLCLLGNPLEVIPEYLDLENFVRWLSARQYQPEGGFSGRSNKLVDGCYSWWVGGCWALLEGIMPSLKMGWVPLWSKADLQKYILCCCQSPRGGLRDKPGKSADFYHSCYVLSGLSVVQHRYRYVDGAREKTLSNWSLSWDYSAEDSAVVEVSVENQIGALNPVHVLPWGVAEKMHDFYAAYR